MKQKRFQDSPWVAQGHTPILWQNKHWAGASTLQLFAFHGFMPLQETSAHCSGLETSFPWLVWRIHFRMHCVLHFQHSVYIFFPCPSELRILQLMKLVMKGVCCDAKTACDTKTQNPKLHLQAKSGLLPLCFSAKCKALSFLKCSRSLNETIVI